MFQLTRDRSSRSLVSACDRVSTIQTVSKPSPSVFCGSTAQSLSSDFGHYCAPLRSDQLACSLCFNFDMERKPQYRLVQWHHKIGYWKNEKEFHPLTNFGLRLMKFVPAPSCVPKEDSAKYKGYIVEVTQKSKRGVIRG